MILETLRAGTRPAHDRLEASVDLDTACRSLDAYRALIARFYGLYAPLEARLSIPAGFDWMPRAPLLNRDLTTLGLTTADISRLPQSACLPDLSGPERTAGCLYVLEGASLGGQVIARRLEERLGLTADHGAAFFLSGGRAAGPAWRAFREAMERFAEGRDEAMIVCGARDTFSAFEYWFSEKAV